MARIAGTVMSSPRKRGCFYKGVDYTRGAVVFPAQAGVFLRLEEPPRYSGRLPRASGGVSMLLAPSSRRRRVFPAQAGVFLFSSRSSFSSFCLPRASGGVSGGNARQRRRKGSSPRKRGCFQREVVVPVPMEGLPRASGGVSVTETDPVEREVSSPRKRGCFRLRPCAPVSLSVFPAQAGVFLSPPPPSAARFRLPRASGGVSDQTRCTGHPLPSSPRKRGCFSNPNHGLLSMRVFPAQAGVFPPVRAR